MTREQAIAETQIHTRQYAKRQWTWFRRDPSIEWFAGFGNEEAIEARVLERICEFLDGAPKKVALV